MFDQTFVDTHAHTRKPWTFSASIAAQTGVVAVVLIVPLMHPEILHPRMEPPIFVALKPLTHPPETEKARTQTPAHTAAPRAFVAPTKVPDRIAKVVDAVAVIEPDNLGMAGPVSNLPTGALIPGLNNTIPDKQPPQNTPPPAKPAVPAGPVSVSTGVQGAKLIFGPKPIYPPLAKASRTQGTVRLEAVIALDGTIKNLKVISGPPLLQKAAVDAVSQWRYRATLLNGAAVEVLTEIDVVFTLSQ